MRRSSEHLQHHSPQQTLRDSPRASSRLAALSAAALVVASLAACAVQPTGYPAPVATYPSSTYPQQTYPASNSAPNYVEYGRVTGVEVIRTQEPGRQGGVGAGAVIGGIAGAVIGHQLGGGTGRDLATIAGGVGGAVAGNAIQNNSNTAPQFRDAYRISVQTDNGAVRAYDLTSAGDLRAGDRVRIENGQIFRL